MCIVAGMMWNTAQSTLEPLLGSGERLLWSGQPRTGIRFRAADFALIPFSIFWCGFAIFWECMALRIPRGGSGPAALASYVFPLFGLPFVLIGLYLLVGRFFFDAWKRGRTFYGVTDERILIVSGVFSRTTTSKDLGTLGETTLKERPDGSGTLLFGRTGYLPVGQWEQPGTPQHMARIAPPAFEMIEEARSVYEIVRNAQKAARAKVLG